jgi:phosphoserine phosphatase RsbU/P
MAQDRTDPPLILIVDDDDLSATVLSNMLAKEGFRYQRAKNGLHARSLTMACKPDLILLDIQMPEEDGFSACKKLKENPQTESIPVIFQTAAQDIESKLIGFSLGAVDYITKPFERNEVLARIRIHLKLHLAYRELVESHIGKLKQLTEAQESILPRPDDLPTAGFAVYYKSLQEAGGYFFDVLPISNQIFDYVVADVSGHDLGSSLATASLKALLHQNPGTIYTLPESLRIINEVLHAIFSEGRFVTLGIARLNRLGKKLTVACAGHPPLIYVHADGRTEIVGSTGDLLGVFPSITVEIKEIPIAPGDRFFLYTDGLIERQGNQTFLPRNESIQKLAELCSEFQSRPLADAVKGIISRLFPENIAAEDDLLILGVEI